MKVCMELDLFAQALHEDKRCFSFTPRREAVLLNSTPQNPNRSPSPELYTPGKWLKPFCSVFMVECANMERERSRSPHACTDQAQLKSDDAPTHADPLDPVDVESGDDDVQDEVAQVIMVDSSQSQSPASPHSPSQEHEQETWRIIARSLGVDLAVAPLETLAYTLLCKHQRNELLTKSQILEMWEALPKRFVYRDKNTEGGLIAIFGANPRNTSALTTVTHQLPHVYQALRAFVTQCVPGFKCSCICLRQNGSRLPHRDIKNIGDSMVVALTPHVNGGGLWIADSEGDVFQLLQGRRIPGRVQDLQEPYVFSARTHLHATQPWVEDRRVVVVAFTPLGTVAIQDTGFLPSNLNQSRISDYFRPLPRSLAP